MDGSVWMGVCGGSPCRMSNIRNGNVALLILRKCRVSLLILRKYRVTLSILKSAVSHVAMA